MGQFGDDVKEIARGSKLLIISLREPLGGKITARDVRSAMMESKEY